MRILLAGAGIGPLADWVDALAEDYAGRFAGRGHDVLLLRSGARPTAADAVTPYRVWRHQAAVPASVRAVSFAARAAMALPLWRPDAVVAFGPFPEGELFWALSHVCACRYATAVHSCPSAGDLPRRMAGGRVAGIMERSQFVVAASGFTRDRLALLGVPRDRIGVVCPGASCSKPQGTCLPRGRPDGAIVLGGAAPLVESSGHDVAIRAMPAILAAFPSAEYRILGGGPEERRLRTLAATLDVDQAVRFLGRFTRSSAAAFRWELDLFLAPFRDGEGETAGAEGLLGVLDAAAEGVPCVGTRSGAIPELVTNGETGLLIPSCSPSALAEAVLGLARDPGMRRRMGAAACSLAASRFRRDAQMDIVLDWLARIVPTRRH